MKALVTTFTLLALLASSNGQSIPSEDRVDCHPDPDANQANCESRGCIYDVNGPLDGTPWCYFPDTYGYKIYGIVEETASGYLIEITKTGPTSYWPNEFNVATVEVEFQTDDRLRVKIHPNVPRYEVPITIPTASTKPTNTQYNITFTNDPTFAFQVIRTSTGTVLFDSGLGGLTLTDQFLQIAARLPSTGVYGFGEHEHYSFRNPLDWNKWAMFSHDWAPNPLAALYGVQPHYTVLETDGNVHSVLFLNSNAQEVQLTPAPGLVYRTIGGILDMYFFLGPSPENSVQQYTEAVGRMNVPVYWSFGFHLCKWGYGNYSEMRAAYDRTAANGIPHDTQWVDIDALDGKRIFTFNSVEFAELPTFIDELHSKEQRFVPITDPGLATGEPLGSYPEFDNGDTLGVWILNATGQPLLGQVWPDNPVHWPDFSKDITQTWWTDSVISWRNKIALDGLWIDMNEIASFIPGSIYGCPSNKYNEPPYLPATGRPSIFEKTICMDAVTEAGIQYDQHSMYAWWMAKASKPAIRAATGERGFVLTRSNFVGSGQWTAHWGGDNFAEWDNLKTSITLMLEYNQFGIPMFGADMCGFFGIPSEEMCARWHLLGAFYPFSRNHNEQDSPAQDPGLWPTTVAINARNSLLIKYRLLPHLYSLFFIHALQGNTVVRPLWHEFPTDTTTWDIDEQFLWGSNFLISPALNEGQTSVNVYFPDDIWYDYFTREVVSSSAGYRNISCDLYCIPLHFRGGAVIPTQQPELTTAASRRNNLELIVTLDTNDMASGDLYWDDGVSEDDAMQKYSHVHFDAANDVLTATLETANYADLGLLNITKVEVWGLTHLILAVQVNPGNIPCTVFQDVDMVLEVDCGDRLNAYGSWTMQWI